MKILAIHHVGALGGGSVSFADLLHMLRDEHEVVACYPFAPPDLNILLSRSGVTLLEAPDSFPTYDQYEGGPSSLSRQLRRSPRGSSRRIDTWAEFIRANDPDLVIVNSGTLAPMGEAISRADVDGVIYVRETIPNAERNPRSRRLYELMDRHFAGALFISSYDESRAEQWLSIPTAVVRDCVQPGAFSRIDKKSACQSLDLATDTFNILFTGGALWYKGLDVALEAIQAHPDQGVRLIVAGYPPMRVSGTVRRLVTRFSPLRPHRFARKVDRLMKSDEVNSRVTILGVQQNMSAAYSASDVVVFPAQVPHQSRPLFEAGNYALPIVSSDFIQYREHFADGLFVPPRDSLAWCRALVSLQSDTARRRQLGRCNQDAAAKFHNMETEKARLLSALAEFRGR